MATSNSNDIYEKLLNELSESRKQLTTSMQEVKICKDENLKQLVSNTTDYRNRFAKEEKLKTITAFYSIELQMRQEYNRNIISEIELRRKLEKGDDGEVQLDIAKIAKQLEKIKQVEKKASETPKLLKPVQVLAEQLKS